MYREIEESPPPRENYSRLIFLPESPSIKELRTGNDFLHLFLCDNESISLREKYY